MSETKPKDIYASEFEIPATGSADQVISGSKIQQGKVVRIVTFYAADLTTVNRILRIGFDRGGTRHWFKRQNAGASAFGICQDTDLILVENETPIMMCENGAAADALVLIARGIYL